MKYPTALSAARSSGVASTMEYLASTDRRLPMAKPIVSHRQPLLKEAREDDVKLSALVEEAGAMGIPIAELLALRWPELYQAPDNHNPNGGQDVFSQRTAYYQRGKFL